MYFLILDSAISYTSSSCIMVNNSPNWEFVPVSMTMPLPRPHLTSVPMKATQVIPETPVLCSFSGRGLMFLPFGMGSPVKLDSSTAKSLACMGRKTFKKRLLVYYYQVFHKSVKKLTKLASNRRMSAGTLSPTDKNTMSPGTRSRARNVSNFLSLKL